MSACKSAFIWHTLVDEFKLGNNVEPDLRKFILEHLQEHWKEMVDSPVLSLVLVGLLSIVAFIHLLLLAEDRSKAADLGT